MSRLFPQWIWSVFKWCWALCSHFSPRLRAKHSRVLSGSWIFEAATGSDSHVSTPTVSPCFSVLHLNKVHIRVGASSKRPFSNVRKQLRKAERWTFAHTVVETRDLRGAAAVSQVPLPGRPLSAWLIGSLLPEGTVSHVLLRLIYLLHKHRLFTPPTNVHISNVVIERLKDVCRAKGTFRDCFLRPAQADGVGRNDAKVKCTPTAHTYSIVNNWNKYHTQYWFVYLTSLGSDG